MFRRHFPWTSLSIPHHHLSVPQMFYSWCLEENLQVTLVLQNDHHLQCKPTLALLFLSHTISKYFLILYAKCDLFGEGEILCSSYSIYDNEVLAYSFRILHAIYLQMRWLNTLLWEVNLIVQDQSDCQCEWHWWREEQ